MDKPVGSGPEYQKIVVLDDVEYKLHIFMPSKAFKLGARVAKVIGEPVVAMASAGGEEAKVAEIMPLAVRALLANFHEDEVLSLIKELLACVTHDGKSIQMDDHFKGRLGLLFKLVGSIIEFQFKDFFEAIGQAVAQATDKKTA